MSNSDSLCCGIWLSCCTKSSGDDDHHSDIPETKKHISLVQFSPIQSERDLTHTGLASVNINVISANTANTSSGWDESHHGKKEVLEYM